MSYTDHICRQLRLSCAARPRPRVGANALRTICVSAARVGMVALFLALFPVALQAKTFEVFGPRQYARDTGMPAPDTQTFTVLDPSAPFTMRIDSRRVTSAVITLNGAEVFGPSDFKAGVTVLTKPVRLLRTNSLTVELRGRPGTGLTLQITGEDNAPPTITAVVTPAPNAAGWHKTDPTVTFNCSDATSGVHTCPAPVTVSVESAGQEVVGMAVDKAGNTATASVTVKLDKTPPSLAFTAPADGTNVFTSLAAVSGTAADALSGLAGLTCNGAPAALNGAVFNCGVPLTQGANSISATATDLAGNATASGLSLNYTRIPVVTITSPANLSYLNISPTTVTGTVDDPDATVVVNSVEAAVVNGSFSVALPLAEGPNVVTASATSANGATGTASLAVTLDTTPPRVTITSPPDQFVTTDSSVSVAGSVNDLVVGTVNAEQAQVSVNGAAAEVSNRTFLSTNVPLSVGPNVIQAVGRDRVGNAATTQITVTRKAPTQAQIKLVSGNNQDWVIGSVLPSPLVVALTDGSGNPVPDKPVIFKVIQNDGVLSAGGPATPTVIATTDATGRAQALWRLGLRAGAGGNLVEAYAVGFEGTAIFTATGSQGQAGKIIIDTGNDQIGAVNQPLPKPLLAVVVDTGNNRLGGVPVTFTVKEGGGSFGGQNTFTVNTDSDGRAAATLTLGPQEGNANNLIEANFPQNLSFPASFSASGRVAGDPQATTISGVVLDNSNVPIPGVTVRAVLTNALYSNLASVQAAAAVQTDAQGQFTIPQAPVGLVKLMVDGTTAQRPGTYPTLEYDLVTVAGQTNNVGMPIFLLPLNENNKLCVTPTTGGGTLTIPEAPGFSLTFGPGQVTFPGGSKTGCVSVTVVHGDKVPMVPGFGQQPRFIVTIQPAGAVFNPPAPITLPNVDGLAPRAVTEMYSFDHDIGSFAAIGTGVVSADGRVISSSPGVGVLKAGWHCGGDPNANGTVADCPACKLCLNNNCNNTDPAQDNKKCTTTAVPLGICTGGNCEPIKVDLTVANATLTLLSVNTLTATVTPPAGSSEVTKYKFEIKRSSEATWHVLQDTASNSFSKKAKVAGRFKLRVTATLSDGTETQSPEKDLEVQFPSYADVSGNGTVISATDSTWSATKAEANATQRRERGFWITLNTQTEQYVIGSTDFGPWVTDLQGASVTPSAKPADSIASPTPLDEPTYTVAYFHTHTPTFYRTVGRPVGPSGADYSFHNGQNVVGIAYDYVGDASSNAPAGWPLHSPAQRYNAGPTRRTTP